MHRRFYPAFAVGLSLLLKLIMWLRVIRPNPALSMTNDSVGYHEGALTLAQLGRFSVSLNYPDVPQTIWTPGYPALIALIYRVFGEQSFWVILIQILVGTATFGLIYWIGKQFGGDRVGVLALILLAADVASFGLTFFMLTETVFTFFLTLMVAFGVGFLMQAEKRTVWLLWMSLALSTTIIIRPIAFYLVYPIAIALIIWGYTKSVNAKTMIRWLFLLLLPYVLIVGGWQLRNYQLTGSSSLSQISGIDLLFFRASRVVELRDNIHKDEARVLLAGESLSVLRQRALLEPELRLGDQWHKEGVHIIRQHPLIYAQVMAEGIAFMMLTPGHDQVTAFLDVEKRDSSPLGDFFRLSPGQYLSRWVVGAPFLFMLFVFSMAYLLIIYIGILLWLWRSPKIDWIAHLFIWGTMLYFIAISAGPEAYSRFRVPIMPFLATYAALGWYALLGHRFGERTK